MGTKRIEDDGYRGLGRNPKTGQILYAGVGTATDPFFERIESADDQPVVKAGRGNVRLREKLVDNSTKPEPVIEPTPEVETITESESAEMALVSLQAEVSACNDKPTLKGIGKTLGLKLTNNMNVSTMRDRIENQIDSVRAASDGA